MTHEEITLPSDPEMSLDRSRSMNRDTKMEPQYLHYEEYDNERSIATLELYSQYATKNPILREALAEFLGTFILVVFGTGAIAQVKLTDHNNGEWLSINLGWGLGLLFGIHCAGGVSGAHLNPAVTTSMALFRKIDWVKVPFYILAQTLGAFCAAAVVFAVYYPLINVADPYRNTMQGIFATYRNEYVTNGCAFLTEVLGTALLLGGICAIGDQANKPASDHASPYSVAMLLMAIGMSFGANSGYALNPARDFGPRLLTAMAGWGSKTFTLQNYYFWIPIVAPFIGGVIGIGTYKLFVEMHHPTVPQNTRV